MNPATFWKSLRHPLAVFQVALFVFLAIKVSKSGRNPVGLVLPFLVLLFLASNITASLQTGKLQSLQGGGADRWSEPKRFRFHLATNLALLAVLNVLFAYAFLSGEAFRLAEQGK